MDIRETIIPRSDQTNAEDFLSGPQTVTITGVSKGSAEPDRDGDPMNADAVRAVEGALLASWKVANDSFSRGMATHAAARDAATAVAAAEPIIRAQIAAEIERKSHEARNEYERGLFRYGSAVEPGSRDPWAEGAIDAYLDAARIARGDS